LAAVEPAAGAEAQEVLDRGPTSEGPVLSVREGHPRLPSSFVPEDFRWLPLLGS